ncbi:RDD family protein [Acinetobacter bereziniae]|uniref:RDD family protein n=1 Tax=Acinetobacter bereziniae TaxID=106648 RepID=A0A8I1DGS9_ACIBZ|nr:MULTISPECIES: RDD family protein [Acinetobacter]MEC8125638.1 RDD family protein [Pseudomonadota bacterium]MBJ8423179.1 RDD family protein [Acinetobacter bereziniae]MBJ9949790.1 RDD family protein [Acinetobacter bereziniae]MCU4475566.1 RDD family protein [Acinetobacter bereziniae]MCU4542220.1 RDD family protein [Acinetobacter bereziniae]
MTEIQNPVKTIAPIFPRLFAFIIDCLIVGVACLVMGKVLYPYFENSPFIFQCLGTLLCLFYFSAFNSSIGDGKTIGKILCKIRVKDFTGASISPTHALIRSSIFIIPFCFIGYLQSFAHPPLTLILIIAFFQSIVFACFYLAVFNGNSQQSLHDVLTRTQILRNTQSNMSHQAIWKVHYYILTLITMIIFSINVWHYVQNQNSTTHDLTSIPDDIQNIQIENRYSFIGETESTNQVLILNVSQPAYLDQVDTAETLIQKLQQDSNILAQYKINQVQFNFSYQFGLAKLSKATIYDYKKTATTTQLTHIGENTSVKLGF